MAVCDGFRLAGPFSGKGAGQEEYHRIDPGRRRVRDMKFEAHLKIRAPAQHGDRPDAAHGYALSANGAGTAEDGDRNARLRRMIETQIIPRLMIQAKSDPAVSALLNAARVAASLMMEDRETSLARIAEMRELGSEEETIWVRMLDPAVDRLIKLLREQFAGVHIFDGEVEEPVKDTPASPNEWSARAAKNKARRGARDESGSN
ncbi:hypothetical protein [Methylocella silvestris]|uniref:hypothetical protein n=1 Tax=Methylocella silvestris TaxID=199596 RepID=UPI0011AF74AB|nr:hypothetical protein [Methylocella silvestris]